VRSGRELRCWNGGRTKHGRRRWRWRASSDEANIDCIDGYSGGSGRVIVWCDKYIVTDTLYNTSLSVSDLSSTSLSVKYYKPAIKFNTSWVPNTTGSYYSSTTSNYVEIHGLLPNTEYSVYGMVETSLETVFRSIRCIPRRRKRQL
jgi:hypothetical protein